MEKFFHEIKSIIDQELSLINQKIKSTTYLEILKFKLIEKIKDIELKNSINLDKDISDENLYEDTNKKVNYKVIMSKLPKININSSIVNDMLIISLNQKTMISVKDEDSNKYVNFNLFPNSGIVLPHNTLCKINYLKNSIILEITLEDKLVDIEKIEENTI